MPAPGHERLRALLVGDEGLRLRVYDDVTGKPIGPGSVLKGHPTIGVGRALDVRGISRAEALQMLDTDIEECHEQCVEEWDWYPELSESRQHVLISMVFNLGLDGVRKFKRMLRAIEQRDYVAASLEMGQSRWAEQVGDRSVDLIRMMAGG